MQKIVNKKITDLIPYVNNPRNNTQSAIDKVASSIKNFGFQNPILIDEKNEIICGHTRFLAGQKLNLKEIPCIVVKDLTPAQIKAYRIADNKVAEFSEWNPEILETELSYLKELDFELEKTEFDTSEIDRLIQENIDYEPEIERREGEGIRDYIEEKTEYDNKKEAYTNDRSEANTEEKEERPYEETKFSPNTNPDIEHKEVTAEDIQIREEERAETFNRKPQLVMTMCPECGAEFEVGGK